MKTFTKQLLQILVLIAAMLACVLNLQAQNMSRYITMTVQNGQQIRFRMKAEAAGTLVRVINGANDTTITVGTDWTFPTNYTAASDTIKVYGDITWFNCSDNSTNLTALDVSNNTALTGLECYRNQLTALDVTNNTALTELYCEENQLTALDVSNNTALKYLYCHGNQLDACALDQMFRTLPERQASDNAKVFIKNGTATNPGVDGCRTPTANAKNWKVMDYNGNVEINNTIFTCANMSRYITMTVQNGQLIKLDLRAAAANTPVRVVSGSTDTTITVGTSWTDFRNYTAGAGTMTVYGDITGFDCSGNSTKLTAIDVTNNTALKVLYCGRNQLTAIDVTNNTALKYLYCYGNQLDACALDQMFRTLPERQASHNAKVYIKDGVSTNPGADGCQTPIANAKNWEVMDYNGDVEINNTTFTCVANMSRYITMTVQNGRQIRLDMKAATANTPVRVVSGSTDTTITVGTSWTGFINYTAGAGTMTVYGDITEFNCGGNPTKLTAIDVSNNTALTVLYCYGNQLTVLDVTNNTALTMLYCYGNQLTALDVTNNTALTVLYCRSNQLTTLDVSNNTALNYLSCDGNQLDACALDQMFRTLPERQASDNARVFIKNGTSTNPGAYGCRTPIANAKNWKVMDWNHGNTMEINNTTFTCANMSHYITMTVQNGQQIKLDLQAAAANTPVRVVSGSSVTDINVGTNWTNFINYTAGASTMTVYGDITGFDCSGNSTKLTAIDVTNNTALKVLYCGRNQLTAIDVTNNTALKHLSCYGNQLDACALDQMFRTLPERQASDNAKVIIKNETSTNPDADGCQTPIANAKNWKVMDWNNGIPMEINNTTFTCVANMSRYITMTVQNGQQIKLDLQAAAANTPVRVVSGTTDTTFKVGTSWTGVKTYTAGAGTMTVYGNITGFDCSGNSTKLTAIDVTNNTALTRLYCGRNQLTTLDVTNNTALKYLYCYGNQLDACALDQMFRTLPERQASDNAKVFIKYGISTNPGADGCRTPIANAKNWKVMDYNGNVEINNTTFTCANMERYITMTVQNGQQIRLNMKAATANTPVRVVSGTTDTTFKVGTSWTEVKTYTAGAGNMTVYGDITWFGCSDNSTKLTTLDVTNNTALTQLYCNRNQLTTLDVTNNTALKVLYCYENQLTALDVTNNTALTDLSCSSNQLTTLDVTNNTALTYLDCSGNQLTALDVTNNTALTQLVCYSNQLTTLDVTNNTALTQLVCYGNQLTALDVTNNTALTYLDCDGNQLTTLDVTNNTALTGLYCNSNQLTTLDVTNNTALTQLYCYGNQLTALDVTNNTALTNLDCYGNQLDACALDQMFRTLPERQASDSAKVIIKNGTSTNPGADGCRTPIANAKNWKVMDYNTEINNTTFTCVANMSRYITMTVQNGQQIELDLQAAAANTPVLIVSGSSVTDINVGTDWTGYSNYTAAADTMTVYGDITGFNCSYNSTKLTTLDVTNNTALTYLSCEENQLTALNVTNNTALTELYCYENQLTALDVTNNTALTQLDCSNNQLTTLDVTNNTALTVLYCSSNQLTTLDITNNTALTNLYCYGNQLTTLDVTNNTALTELYCTDNQLTTLDVSNNTALTNLYCYENQLDACALDQMFRTLPERQASDNARVFIKYGTITNPGVDGCRTPIANAKNWKVMDYNGNVEINNTTFTCANMERYITMTVQNGQQIGLNMKAATANTPVRIVSGSSVTDINVGTSWTGIRNFTASADTMTVYGDITAFNCKDNQSKLTAIDVRKNTTLTELDCSKNQLTTLDVSNNTALTQLRCYNNQLTTLNVKNCSALKLMSLHNNQIAQLDITGNIGLTELFCNNNQISELNVLNNPALKRLDCYGNLLDACALEGLFHALPTSLPANNARVFIKNGTHTNPGADGCLTSIANAKNWKVMDWNNGNPTETNNTISACVANMSRYITMTVQNGQQIQLDMKAATANTPVRVVSGSSVTNILVGDNWTGFSNYTAAADTMTVYGDITWFDCSENTTNLTALDVTNNTALTELVCYGNQLTTLDVTNNTALTVLYCYENQLTTLVVSNNTALTVLDCSSNQLTTLDVTNNTALTVLYCYENQLTTLDVTNNTALTELYCYDNQLTTLDVTNDTALTELYCSNNQLTTLDVTNNTALTVLYCSNNQLTTLDVTNNTALTELGCDNNQLTTLDVTNNTALTQLECYGNQLDACALDQMFRTLPERQASDNAKVIIKDGTATNPGVDGCQTPIANAKNWKVMDLNNGNPMEINNTTFTCANMNRYITMTVQNGQQIKLNLQAAAANTPVRIVSGSNVTDINVGTDWTGLSNYTAAADTMTVYGDITGFDCSDNSTKLTTLDVSNNTALTRLGCDNNQLTTLDVTNNTALTELYCTDNQLTTLDVTNNTALTQLYCSNNQLTTLDVTNKTVLTELYCSNNQLTTLDVTNNTALTQLECYGNQLDACALDQMFRTLPERQASDNAKVFIKYGTSTNPGVDGCQTPIANAKNWKVMDLNNGNPMEINNTTFTCTANMSRYITMTVQNGQQIKLDMKAATANTPVRVVSGSSVTNILVGDNLTGLSNYTAAADTMTVYGDITGFNCSENSTNLTALDVTNNTALIELNCGGNQLTTLDVTNNTALTVLNCYGNQLTALDVTNNTALTVLNCYGNQLTAIDVSNNAALTGLYCYGNQLTALDVTNNTALTVLNCYGNQLTAIDVSNNTALTVLNCYGNQLTAIDVSNNAALTGLYCGGNQLTAIDVTSNTALTNLYCHGNQLDACALDQMFSTLPQRQASDNAKVIIKNGTATNPGVDGCQTPIANAKNWKVMDASGNVEINNTTFTCTANMSRYITMTVQNGQQIKLDLVAAAANTLVRVVSGTTDTTFNVGTSWTGFSNYTAAADTMTVYGDITGFDCRENSTKLTAIVSNNAALTWLYCGGNQLTTLDVTNNTVLKYLSCYGNQLDACALDQMFSTLPQRQASNNAKVFIKNGTATNPGVDGCQTPIANAKNWKVMDYSEDVEINNTTFTCVANMSRYITMTVQNGQQIKLDLQATAANTLVRVVSGTTDTTFNVGTSWTGFSNYTAAADTMTVYGDITGFDCSENSTKLTAIDVSNNTALTSLHCSGNQLTTLDVTNNTALTVLKCYGNQLDACALDQMFRTLPERQASDNARVIIKNGTATNPGADGCQTPIANAKNWKVMDASGDVEINNTTFTCANMERYITMNVQNGQQIKLDLQATAANTLVRVVSGTTDTTFNVGTSWTGFRYYTAAADTMTVYGDITGFNCGGNSTKLTAIDVSNNTALTSLYCYSNQLTALDVTNNTALTILHCYGNQLTALDVTNNTALTNLNCGGNQLTTLDVINNTALTELECYGNQLTTLDVSNNTALTVLNCYGNQLTAIDVSNNAALTGLYCGGNQLTALDVTNNTALRVLGCSSNQLTALDVTNNTALTTLYCHGNLLDACALDQMFSTLPQRQASDNARVFIKNGTSTNPGADGCRTPIANAKNWKVMDASGDVEINNTTFTCANMERYITMNVQNGEAIQLKLIANEANTPIRIVSGANDTTVTVGTAWTDFANYTAAADTMKVFGDIVGFDCSGNTTKINAIDVKANTELTELNCSNNQLTALDVSNNIALTYLNCSNNQLTALDVSNSNTLTTLNCSNNQLTELYLNSNSDLSQIYCFGNQLDDCALDGLFRTLPTRQASDSAKVVIKNGDETNPGADGCQTPLANAKNWKVVDGNGNVEINNTTFTCTANMNRYITSIVQNGAVIMLNLMADAANTPISIVSGTNIKDTIIGTNWTGTVNFTANTDTVIVYGNIAAFDCGNNQTALTKIELNNNNNLKGLYCYNNQITTLDLSSCTNLQILNCNDNQIPNIDVTNNTALTELYCQNNQITELNLNNNSAVISLECKGNQLSTLNVSNNTALKNLRCDNNQITSLNVNNNPDLITLHCGNNMINSLELSNNSQLINFACNNNQIRALDLSNNNALTTLNCSGNMLSDCALDSLFRSLPTRNQDDSAIVVIKNEDETNPGADGCRTPIANAKNWKVMDWNNGNPMEINNTTFTCQEVNIDNILTDHVIKLYPNPVNSELYIATDAEVRIIQVFNMNGVEVARKFESNRIDLNHLQPNTYIVRITTDINSSNQFVVKQ